MRLLCLALAIATTLACQERRDVTAVLVLDGVAERGRATYQMQCARCHGSQGHGVGGAPVLAGKVGDLHDPAIAALIVNGRGGMPSSKLTDQQVADVLAWLRATWP